MRAISFYIKYVILLYITCVNSASALDGASIGIGVGDASVKVYRAALDWRWPVLWCENCFINIGGYLEASYAHLDGSSEGGDPTSNSSLNAYAITPVFRFITKEKFIGIKPYFEGSIGLAWLSESEIGGRNLGLHGQFEDRAGFGAVFGQNEHMDMNFRFMHFSNGFLGADNHGINIYYINSIYWF